MTEKKLIQISDIHLSRARAYTYTNWEAVLAYIHATQPDLVVNTGDYVLDSPEDKDDLIFGHEQMQRLSVEWKSLPGDHDIGGGPPQPTLRPHVPWLEHYMTTESRRIHYLELFGEDHWAMPFGDWYFIGLNDLIFESGFADEEIQWQFLKRQLHEAGNQPTAIFMHKPPCIISITEADYVTNAIPGKARDRLWQMMKKANVRLIAAGHLHVYRTLQTMGVTVVVAPTLMRGKDDFFSKSGHNTNGIVEYTFVGESVEFRLVTPPGVKPLNLPDGARQDWPAFSPEGAS